MASTKPTKPREIPREFDLIAQGIETLENFSRFSNDPNRVANLLLSGIHPDGHCAGLTESPAPQGTPLMMAASNGRSEIVKSLLKAGANPFIIDPYGFDALTYAAKASSAPAIKVLLEQVDYDVNRLKVACLAATVSREAACAMPIADKLRILLDKSAIAKAAPDPHTKPLGPKSI